MDYHIKAWQKLIQKLASTKIIAWALSKFLHDVDQSMLSASNSQKSLTNVLSGVPIVVLTTIGAKSGKRRTVPLVGLMEDESVILIASNWGQSRHPAWYHNLKANPEVKLSIDNQEGVYMAREATAEERLKYWDRAIALYAGFGEYKKRAKNRKIPMVILRPVILTPNE